MANITPEQARAELARRASAQSASDIGITKEQAIQELERRKSAAIDGVESEQSKALRSELAGMTQNPEKALYDQLPAWQKPFVAADDIVRLGASGLSFGFADKAAAAIQAPLSEKTYEELLAEERQKTESARKRSGGAGTVAEIGGAVAAPMGLASRGVTLAGRLGSGTMTGAKGVASRAALLGAEGAGYGVASAIGNDTDPVAGGIVGAVTGTAFPLAASAARTVAKPVIDAVSARVNPAEYAAIKVSERLGNSMSPEQAAARMERNPGTSLADIGGKSVRDLLRTSVNIPGPAKDRVAAQLTVRQFGQGDRLKRAVADTFADPDGYLLAKDTIAEEASRLAKPLYEEAYSRPVHFSKTLENILSTPAGRQALKKAETLAANEQQPFQQMFANVADDGTASIKRVPDTRGWDYIKRSFDDMIAQETDSLTKKVSNEGRILASLRNKMLSEVDRYNPVYKQARQVFTGQAQLDDALELGRSFSQYSPQALKRALSDMGEAERATARIGAAEALRDQIVKTGVTQNAVLRLFSKRGQIEGLKELFETPEQFAEFRRNIFAEARKRATYEAVKGNSSTASQLADMAETGGLKDTMEFAKSAATQGPVTATMQWVGSRLRMLGGLTPDVADHIARQLTTSNPANVGKVIAELSRVDKLQLNAQQKRQAIDSFISRTLGVTAGLTAAPVASSAAGN